MSDLINNELNERHQEENILVEKWSTVLDKDSSTYKPITENVKRTTTAMVLENQEKYINENINSVQGMATWNPILMSMARRAQPKLVAYDVCGVQTMDAPQSYIFAMRAVKNDKGTYANDPNNTEILHDKHDTTFSGTGVENLPTNSFGDYTNSTFGTGMDTAKGETADWNDIGITIEKKTIEAKTRQLKATYSQEMNEDMKRIHGLSADSELLTMLSNQVVVETNRETLLTIYKAAKIGAQFTAEPGVFNLDVDSDGRWSAEKFKGLRYAIMRDANQVAIETRRGKANKLICSAGVATALELSGMLTYTPTLEQQTQLEVDATGVTYAGRMGMMDVYIDPYAVGDGYVVGYKGSQWDAGIYHCPYVPLQLSRAVNSDVFHNTMGFKTRYATAANPFSTLDLNSNAYYRKVVVKNL